LLRQRNIKKQTKNVLFNSYNVIALER